MPDLGFGRSQPIQLDSIPRYYVRLLGAFNDGSPIAPKVREFYAKTKSQLQYCVTVEEDRIIIDTKDVIAMPGCGV